jgi:hypothetical protein
LASDLLPNAADHGADTLDSHAEDDDDDDQHRDDSHFDD